LILWQPATLTIQPATPIPSAGLAPFAYRGRGDGFILYPVIPNVPGIQFLIAHFSAYGAGSGTSTDTASPSGGQNSDPLAPYVQELAEIEMQARAQNLLLALFSDEFD